MSRRVVVTGQGVLSPLGDDAGALHRALREGRSGLGSVELFETEALSRPRAGEIRGFNAKSYLGKKNMRPLDRTARLVTTATHLALQASGWTAEARAGQDIGLVLGTVYGSVRTIAEFDRHAIREGPAYASPLDFANTVINAAAGQTAIWHGLRGVNSTIATGQASGLNAIAYAAGLIASGRAEVLLAGGVEELCLESFLSLERAGMLDLSGEGDPVPFAAGRRGFLPGEGVGLLVLESAELAARRGAPVLAEVRGHGVSFDPQRGQDEAQLTGAIGRAVGSALTGAQLEPGQLGALSVSANGGPADEMEAGGLAEALGASAEALPIVAIKSCLGETLGADGGLQAVVAVQTITNGEQPGIRGLAALPSGFPFPLAGPQPRDVAKPCVLLHSMGWDGHHCAVILSRPRES